MFKSYFSFKKIIKLNIDKIRYKILKSFIFFTKGANFLINKIKTNIYIASINKIV